jgi:hypothetical protein
MRVGVLLSYWWWTVGDPALARQLRPGELGETETDH